MKQKFKLNKIRGGVVIYDMIFRFKVKMEHRPNATDTDGPLESWFIVRTRGNSHLVIDEVQAGTVNN